MFDLRIFQTHDTNYGNFLFSFDQIYHEHVTYISVKPIKKLASFFDLHIDDVFFCPFHPEHGIGSYKKDSHSRKPNPGMLIEAKKKWKINPVN